MKINCLIPARLGSERIKLKNLRLMNGHPLAYWAAKIAQESTAFDRVCINSEAEEMEEIAKEAGCEFYLRKPWLASNTAKSDDFVADFMIHRGSDYTVVVNPTSPLLPSNELAGAIKYFTDPDNDWSTIHSVAHMRTHSLMGRKPLNFDKNEKLPKTQGLMAVSCIVFAFAGFRNEQFLEHYKEYGHAYFTDPVAYFAVSKLAAVDIDTEEDWEMAERIMTGSYNHPSYHPSARDYEARNDT